MCGAGYGQRGDERVNARNGYRTREWDVRAGTIDLTIPKSHGPAPQERFNKEIRDAPRRRDLPNREAKRG